MQILEKIRRLRHPHTLSQSNKSLIENFSYITLLEVFVLLSPMITYPYLVRVLGLDLYGVVITAQVLTGYASKIIDFGSNHVCAKHVSINRENNDKLSEIVCSVFFVRSALWLVCLFIYIGIVCIVPIYRSHFLLFLLSYGLTFSDVLFPQYFFQGIEKMKISSLINLGIRTLFIILIFIAVKDSGDYIFVPTLYTIGYLLAGLVSFIIIFRKMGVKFIIPEISQMKYYVKDSSAIFATDMICTIKDKLNYFFIGSFCSMGGVVVYDLCSKINALLVKPSQILSKVFFPRFAKNRDGKDFINILLVVLVTVILLVILTNVFLPFIVTFFINKQIDLLPVRIFTLAPIFLSLSSFICSNYFVAFGHNKYVLYSIIITTAVYVVSFGFVVITSNLNSIYSYIYIALVSYFAEFIYRAVTANKIIKQTKK